MRSLKSVIDEVFCAVSHHVTVEMRWRGDDVLLAHLAVDGAHRGAGLAGAALARICAIADAEGWTLVLQPSDGFGSHKGRLARWYYRHGFIPEGQPEFVSQIRWMRRAPR